MVNVRNGQIEYVIIDDPICTVIGANIKDYYKDISNINKISSETIVYTDQHGNKPKARYKV